MNATKKAVYLAPQLTAVDIKPERGYAVSNLLMEELNLVIVDQNLAIDPNSQNYVEVYETGNNWTEGSNHFWD